MVATELPQRAEGVVLTELRSIHPALSVFRKSAARPRIDELSYEAPDDSATADGLPAEAPSLVSNGEAMLTEDNLMAAHMPSFDDSSMCLPSFDESVSSHHHEAVLATPRPSSVEPPRSILKPPRTSTLAHRLSDAPRNVTFTESTAAPVSPPEAVVADPRPGPPFYAHDDESEEVIVLGGSPLNEEDQGSALPTTPSTPFAADLLESDDEDSRSFQRLSPGIGLHLSRANSAPSLASTIYRPPMRGSRSDAFFLDRLRAAIPTPDASLDNVDLRSPPLSIRTGSPLKQDADASLPATPERFEASAETAPKPLPPTPIDELSSFVKPEASARYGNAVSSPLASPVAPASRPSHSSSCTEFGVILHETPSHSGPPQTPHTGAAERSIYATPAGRLSGEDTIYLSPSSSPTVARECSNDADQTRHYPGHAERSIYFEAHDKPTGDPRELIEAQDELLSARAAERNLLLQLVDSLRTDISLRDDELSDMRRQRDQAELALSEALEEASQWEREYGDRSSEHAAAKRKKVQAIGAELRAQIDRLQVEADRVPALLMERDRLQADLEVAQVVKTDKVAFEEVEAWMAQKQDLEDRLSAAEQHGDAETLRASKAVEALEAVRRQAEELAAELARVRDAADGYQASLEDARSQLAALDADKQRLEATNTRLQEQLGGTLDADATSRRLHDELARMERERSGLEADLRDAQKDIEQARGAHAAVMQECAAMAQLELENARLRDDLLELDVKSTCAACSTSAASVEQAQVALRKAQNDSAAQGVAMAKLQKANAALKDDREGLLIALEAKQQELKLLKRRSSDTRQLRDSMASRRQSSAPQDTIRGTTKVSKTSMLSSAAVSATPSAYDETPIRPQLLDRRAVGSALYGAARRPGVHMEEKENRAPVPMLA